MANPLEPGIKQWFRNGFKNKEEVKEMEEEKFVQLNEQRQARGMKPLKWEEFSNEKEEDDEKTKAKAGS